MACPIHTRQNSGSMLAAHTAHGGCMVLYTGLSVQDLLLLSQKGGGNVSAELMEVQRKAKANGAVHHYKVLGVQSTAAPGDIKSAYR